MNIQQSDWVASTTSTGQTWVDENPEAAEEFKKALEDLDFQIDDLSSNK